MGGNIHTDEDLLDEIRRLAKDGKAPTQTEMSERGAHSPSTYRRRFGSWAAALDAAGFGKPTRVSEADLVRELRRLSEKGFAPTGRQMRARGAYSDTLYYNRFGSWLDAIAAAGLEAQEGYGPSARIAREDLRGELQRLAEDGHAPTKREMRDQGEYDPSRYEERWGSWTEAVEANGLQVAVSSCFSAAGQTIAKMDPDDLDLAVGGD